MPEWAWLVIAWLVLAVVLALGVGRWFRWLSDDRQDWDG